MANVQYEVPADDPEDPELALQEALSSLAAKRQEDVKSCLQDLLLSSTKQNEHESSTNGEEPAVLLLQLGNVIESPFEMHAVVVQSMVFMPDDDEIDGEAPGEGNKDGFYRLCCIVLMALALRRCPDPLTNRFKRWTSILCETIRHFQAFLEDYEDVSELSLLMSRTCSDFMLPAGWTVLERINKSSDSSLKTAIVSAFVSISTHLAAAVSRATEEPLELPALETLASAFEAVVDSKLEPLLYSYPIWKEKENFENESIERWATAADNFDDDRLCHINTNWNDFGVTLLLLQISNARLNRWETLALDSNVITSASTWARHAHTLLENGMWKNGLKLLEAKALVDNTDGYFPTTISPTVASTLELLCNYLWNAAMTKQDPSVASSTYLMMQRLIQRCPPPEQVQVVRQLVERCPYPGLVPKLFDLWRGLLVSEEPPPTSLWESLDDRLKLLAGQVERATQSPSSDEELLLEDLMVDLESHISVLTMLQVYVLQRKLRPPCRHLPSIARTASILSSFSRESLDDGYRLDLLQDSLTRLLQCLDAL